MRKWQNLPGAHHLTIALPDLEAFQEGRLLSESALLILMARPELLRLGVPLPAVDLGGPKDAHQLLFERLELRLGGRAAASRAFGALQREVHSFARAFDNLVVTPFEA